MEPCREVGLELGPCRDCKEPCREIAASCRDCKELCLDMAAEAAWVCFEGMRMLCFLATASGRSSVGASAGAEGGRERVLDGGRGGGLRSPCAVDGRGRFPSLPRLMSSSFSASFPVGLAGSERRREYFFLISRRVRGVFTWEKRPGSSSEESPIGLGVRLAPG
mmetsp:Transcript_56046/g.133997  ORF Transcript_56046/g.133997 Transcript_56046/m.133997 type:complete len:164 (+) Transcript_56046:419-910(+)